MYNYRVLENEYVFAGKPVSRDVMLAILEADKNKYADPTETLNSLELIARIEGVITLRLSRGAVVTVAYKEDDDV